MFVFKMRQENYRPKNIINFKLDFKSANIIIHCASSEVDSSNSSKNKK